ncbi:FecR family protein [Pedobacter psychrodurus]|uniref:FecR family protein n=1 Tax=Pedobacter psychrodurus TaxID=2530456 RepID=UPI00292D5D95|nr:FecR domain-containing protein [Pedobacter psychrodurus]
MQERNRLTALFQKYQQGLVNEEEKTMIARWLIQLEVMGEQLTPAELQAKAALSRTELKSHFFPPEIPKTKIVRLPIWLKSIAASLFFAVLVASIYYINHQSRDLPVQTALVQTVTRVGEMKIISLPDGSKVTLNNQSRLRYPLSFNGKSREIYLTGEAFFEVAHHAKKPFRIHTDKLEVQVLGTSFNVSAYPEDNEISVAVATGKVGVFSKNNKKEAARMLLPGDRLSYNRSNASFSHSRLAIADISSWNVGKLVFRNETLENITKQLKRYYRVNFLFKNNILLAKQISLKTNNLNIATLMKALSLSGDFRYEIEGNQITLW